MSDGVLSCAEPPKHDLEGALIVVSAITNEMLPQSHGGTEPRSEKILFFRHSPRLCGSVACLPLYRGRIDDQGLSKVRGYGSFRKGQWLRILNEEARREGRE